VARRSRRRISNADKFVTAKPQRCRYEWKGGFSSGTLYCEDVASGFSTTCIRVLNLNPGRYTSCRSKWPRGLSVSLRPLTQWDCGFESRRGRGCLSLVSVVCCQVVSLRRADHSSRGVLPSVVCPMSVIVKPRKGRP
jgi:hypothetical protein